MYGKGLVSIYELTYSIKDKFSNSEIKLINDEKKISNNFSKNKIFPLKKHMKKEDIEEESTYEIENYYKKQYSNFNTLKYELLYSI